MNAIEIVDVSVAYRTRRVRNLKELVVRTGARAADEKYFYSLQNISLTIRRGEAVGIVGSNGAGKSTLLRVAAGIVIPTSGHALSVGRVAPLIELGANFEGDLSGRENIYFNGAFLGRSRKDMRARVDEIVAFAELEEFIDAPLRTYSTGTVARLAMSIAMTVDAETILIDELFAIGDAAFRERCGERLKQFVQRGATLVVVSHDIETIRTLCARALLLSHGHIIKDGLASDTVDSYRASSHTAPGQ